MTLRDTLASAFRHSKTRPVESLLIVIAVALAVGITTAVAVFIVNYNQETERLLNHPSFRELVVRPSDGSTAVSSAVERIDNDAQATVRFSEEDLLNAATEVDEVSYGYLAQRQQFGRAAFVAGAGARDRIGALLGGAAAGDARSGAGGATGGPTPDSAGGASGAVGAGGAQLDQAQVQNLRNQLQEVQRRRQEAAGALLDNYTVLRVTPSFFPAYDLTPRVGSIFSSEENNRAASVIVLGSSIADRVFGGEDPMGRVLTDGVRDYTVIGILEAVPYGPTAETPDLNEAAYVPFRQAPIAFGDATIDVASPVGAARFTVADTSNLAGAIAGLQAYFDREYGVDAAMVDSRFAEVSRNRNMYRQILVVVLFLSAMAVLIASINIFSLMLTRVVKRTRGVGIMRALGASRTVVFTTFFSEAMVLSAVGAVLGLALVPVVNALLAQGFGSAAAIAPADLPVLIGAMAAAVAVTLIFGVLPARQATRINAADAIRAE